MKECPYCGKMNEDQEEICVRCKAGFPHEEKPKKKETEVAEDEPLWSPND